MKAALLMLTYILGFGVVVQLVLGAHPPQWAIYLLVAAFFVGWFVVLGIVGRVDAGRSVAGGPREGIAFMLEWAKYLVFLAAIGAAVWLLAWMG